MREKYWGLYELGQELAYEGQPVSCVTAVLPSLCDAQFLTCSSIFSSCHEDEGGKLIYVVTFIPFITTLHAERLKSSTVSPCSGVSGGGRGNEENFTI